jgi:hypothetical protein
VAEYWPAGPLRALRSRPPGTSSTVMERMGYQPDGSRTRVVAHVEPTKAVAQDECEI